MALPQEIIRRKRDGKVLTRTEIAEFVSGLVTGAWSEGQIAAFAMATLLKGMDREETVALTLEMRDSGTVLDWTFLPGPATDKHSTGGVGGQCFPDAGAHRGGMRCLCADDLGARGLATRAARSIKWIPFRAM